MEHFSIFDDFEEEVVVIDQNYKIVYANNKYLEDLGYTSLEEVLGMSCYKVSHQREEPCDGECHPCPLREIEKTGRAVNVIHTHYTHNGGEFPVEICAFPLKNGSILQIIKNIKSDKEKYYLFSMSQRLSSISHLALGVAHQISTPLNIIYTYVQMLEKKHGTDEDIEKVKEAILVCKDYVSRLLLMVRNSKERSLIDVKKAVQDSVELIEVYAKEKDVRIEGYFEDCGFLLGSEADIRHIVTNLLINAIDVSEKSKKVVVKTYKEKDYAVISVEDEGPGIEHEEIHKIFLPFYKGKRSKEGEGCGLGLSIVSSIVKYMEGIIEVQTALGGGSKFIVKLPLNV